MTKCESVRIGTQYLNNVKDLAEKTGKTNKEIIEQAITIAIPRLRKIYRTLGILPE